MTLLQKKDEFHKFQMEQFAFQAEEKVVSTFRKLGKNSEELRGREDAHGSLVQLMKRLTLRDDCKIKNHICLKK